jgi:hypothetical protein
MCVSLLQCARKAAIRNYEIFLSTNKFRIEQLSSVLLQNILPQNVPPWNVQPQNVPPTKRPRLQNVPPTKRPCIQNVLAYKTSRLQKVHVFKTSSPTKRPSITLGLYINTLTFINSRLCLEFIYINLCIKHTPYKVQFVALNYIKCSTHWVYIKFH